MVVCVDTGTADETQESLLRLHVGKLSLGQGSINFDSKLSFDRSLPP